MKLFYLTLENLSLHKGFMVHVKEVIVGLKRQEHQVGRIACAWNRPENIHPFNNIYPRDILGTGRAGINFAMVKRKQAEIIFPSPFKKTIYQKDALNFNQLGYFF